METSVVLRAVAILTVCANHIGLFNLGGGAHILLAVAGYSFARFQLNAVASSARVRPLVHSIARIVVPSMVVIAIAYVVNLYGRVREYAVWNVFLIEDYFDPDVGPDGWDHHWDYWFIEVLVSILVVWAVLLSIPAVRRLERAQPFGFAIAFLGVCLIMRFHIFVGEVSMEPFRAYTVVWLFALGWAAARASRVSHRMLLTVAAVCGAMLPGFFDEDEGRKLAILGYVLLLVWVARVPLHVALRRLTALLAGAPLDLPDAVPDLSLPLWGESLSGLGYCHSGMPPELRRAAEMLIVLAVGVFAWKAYTLTSRTSLDSGREASADGKGPFDGEEPHGVLWSGRRFSARDESVFLYRRRWKRAPGTTVGLAEDASSIFPGSPPSSIAAVPLP